MFHGRCQILITLGSCVCLFYICDIFRVIVGVDVGRRMKHRGDSGRPALKIEQVKIVMIGRSRKYLVAIVSSMKKKWRVLMCKLESMRTPRRSS